MGNRIKIICAFATVMAVIFHGRLFMRWYEPLVYVQYLNTLAALIALVWRSYVWIDLGNGKKWHYQAPREKGVFVFQHQQHIKIIGWAVFLATLTCACLVFLGTEHIDFVIPTHFPLFFLAFEFFIPHDRLMPIEEYTALQAAKQISLQNAPAPNTHEYQANPVYYQQQKEAFEKKPPPTKSSSFRFGRK